MSNVIPLIQDIDEDDELALALAAAPPIVEAPEPEVSAVVDRRSPIEAQWARFRPQFAEAMEGGLYTVEDLEAKIASGAAYFWPGRNSAVVAERVEYPGETVMQTMWSVGDLEEVIAMAPGIEATARLLGCTSMLLEGRKGWEKILRPHGYEPWSVTLRKAL